MDDVWNPTGCSSLPRGEMFLAYLQSINKQKYTLCAFGIPEMPVLNLLNGREPQFAWADEYLCGSMYTKTQRKLREAGVYASSLSIAIMVSMKRAKFYVYVLTSLYLAWILISKFLDFMWRCLGPARLASWSVMSRSGIRGRAVDVFVTAAVLLLPPVFLFCLFNSLYHRLVPLKKISTELYG